MKIEHVVVAAIVGTAIVFYDQICELAPIQWLSEDWHWMTVPVIIMAGLSIAEMIAETFRGDR